jgi:8-oxo-dGTP diphosphatase
MIRGTTNIPVACVIIKKADKILALRRSNTGYEDGNYGLPAGHVEDGENFRQAACREVLEETGLHITPEQLTFKLILHEKHPEDIRVILFFEATDWRGEPTNAEPHKHDQLTWLNPSHLPTNLMKTLPEALSAIAAGQTYAEYGW